MDFPGQLPPNARVRYMEASFTTLKNHLNNQLESIGFKSQITPTLELPSFYAQDHERCVTHRIFSRSNFVSMTCDPCVFVLTRRKEFVDSNGVVNTIAPSGAIFTSPLGKRRKLTPPPCERIMIYVRQENEVAFTPLHLLPPTSLGLLDAVSPPSSSSPPPPLHTADKPDRGVRYTQLTPRSVRFTEMIRVESADSPYPISS